MKKPAPVFAGSGFVEVVVRFFDLVRQRQETSSQPATNVVVMPICMMAVIAIAKHCSGLIPDEGSGCQTNLDSYANYGA